MNMNIFKILILSLVFLYFGCKRNKDNDLGIVDEFSNVMSFDVESNSNTDEDSNEERTLEGLIAEFDLSMEERGAVEFLRTAITNPSIAKDKVGIKTYTEEEFYEFLATLEVDKTREAIADIVITLKARDDARNAIYDLADDHPQRQNFESQLDEKEQQYLRELKIVCSSENGYDGAYLGLKANRDAFIFKSLKGQIDDSANAN
ncbi:hypothetical protein CR532_04555 (plasmid) [Candidatus Borreliella tachyglossi]|uniref:Lipoprotein n=1 Tax=Candidatus Borreliella tachyglossi TaxID=1964448 RepID=A0A2S1LYC6_9SPIR|nr:hypothetical protein [Candidatus Borreliella tachyglossi]AWG43271.1 hypothetical protein CR532_04555 [Candidatus Borreliella tachyglossi]